eukprot:755922-Hanusia_phi.AAC.4
MSVRSRPLSLRKQPSSPLSGPGRRCAAPSPGRRRSRRRRGRSSAAGVRLKTSPTGGAGPARRSRRGAPAAAESTVPATAGMTCFLGIRGTRGGETASQGIASLELKDLDPPPPPAAAAPAAAAASPPPPPPPAAAAAAATLSDPFPFRLGIQAVPSTSLPALAAPSLRGLPRLLKQASLQFILQTPCHCIISGFKLKESENLVPDIPMREIFWGQSCVLAFSGISLLFSADFVRDLITNRTVRKCEKLAGCGFSTSIFTLLGCLFLAASYLSLSAGFIKDQPSRLLIARFFVITNMTASVMVFLDIRRQIYNESMWAPCIACLVLAALFAWNLFNEEGKSPNRRTRLDV